MIRIFNINDSDNFSEQLYQQQDKQNTHYEDYTDITDAVNATSLKITTSTNNSNERKDEPFFNKELIIVGGILFIKVVLWMLYRAAQEEGLDVSGL